MAPTHPTPVISAPHLVASTNQQHHGMISSSSPSSTTPEDEKSWQTKYVEARLNYRKVKQQMRDQAKKSRQLIVAVTAKLAQDEEEMNKLKQKHDQELSNLCQQLMCLQGCMNRERERVEGLLREKDRVICLQRAEIDKLVLPSCTGAIAAPKAVSVTPSPTSSTNSSGSSSTYIHGGSLRIHGSFRQYKKDREKYRQQLRSAADNSDVSSSSSGVLTWTANSSEESSSSPTTLPRTQRHLLRQTVSSSCVEEYLPDLPKSTPRKGILKASSSYDGSSLPTSKSDTQSILDSLHKLMENESNASGVVVKKVISEEKSDSGRESDDIEPPEDSTGNVSVVTVSTDSANSSFDASDPTLAWRLTVVASSQGNKDAAAVEVGRKKPKPPPPPRSSQTRLSTKKPSLPVKPKSILSYPNVDPVVSSELSATQALDNLIHNNNSSGDTIEKKKRVKFNPHVDTSIANIMDASSSQLKPLDPNFLHFLPKLAHSETNQEVKDNFSYYEPYI